MKPIKIILKAFLEGLGIFFLMDFIFAINPNFDLEFHMMWQICFMGVICILVVILNILWDKYHKADHDERE